MSQENKKIVIYQHVPKCAGQSFRAAWKSMGFEIILEKPPKHTDHPAWEAFLANKVDVAALPGDSLICGHLIHDGIRPRDRYPEEIAKWNIPIVTLLRDPMERAISAYFYRQRQGKQTLPTVEDQLRKVRNPIASHLGYTVGPYRDFLETFLFVGASEHLQASVDVLARLLDRPAVHVPRINITPRKPYEISDETRRIFRERNHVDYALTDDGLALLKERHLAVLGAPLPERAARMV